MSVPFARFARLNSIAVMTATFAAMFSFQPRASADCVVTPSPDWKHTVSFPFDPFRVAGESADRPGWIKFTILTCDQTKVYFQNSVTYPFHYNFATQRLDPFIGMTPAQYEAVSLHATNQQAILGSIIIPPEYIMAPFIPEFGIQLVRQDPYDLPTTISLLNLVKSKVTAEPNVRAFYFPTFEQSEFAHANSAALASAGFEVSSTSRWVNGNSCYANGWALGRLKYVPGSGIAAAYANGTLGPTDILLTDGVPAEVPFLAGIVTLTPSTPSSHVAILASTWGAPFVHLSLESEAARAQSLIGHKVILRATPPSAFGQACDVRLIDIESGLPPGLEQEILALKVPPALNLPTPQPYSAYSAPTNNLQISDAQFFGGKAANFGILRRSIPANSPVSAAISFNLWNEFLDQTLSNGQTLRAWIAGRLATFTWPPANPATVSATLSTIRDVIRSTSATQFTPAQQAAVIAILQDPQYGFDPNRNIRFRSSTNFEDGDEFTGAGLFDSFSGCLADELDGDNAGPSICDPTESGERGVFRAIRRVYASFYNDNAYLERLRHNVSESQIQMGMLVHHSFPDPFEMANGVAVLTYQSGYTHIDLVTQTGATSVTNPTDGSIPEEVSIDIFNFGTFPTVQRESNLVQLGATVLAWQSDYIQMATLLKAAGDRYKLESGLGAPRLEFEFKKEAPTGALSIKQIRRLPAPSTTPTITPFLINEPTEYCVFQGEAGDAMANHRLKCRMTLHTRSMRMTPANLQQSIVATVDMEYAAECDIHSISSPMDAMPTHTYSLVNQQTRDGWRFDHLNNARQYTLLIDGVGALVSELQSPILTIRDLGQFAPSYRHKCIGVLVEHEDPVPYAPGTPIFDPDESAVLCPCRDPGSSEFGAPRVHEGPNGVTVETSYRYVTETFGFGGFTFPLDRFNYTIISGLTTAPITLTSMYSQSFRPQHHNFGEHFVFEPHLEPNLPQQQRAELDAANIRIIHILGGQFGGEGDFAYFSNASSGQPCGPCAGVYDADVNGDQLRDGRDVNRFVQVVIGAPSLPAERCGADVDRNGIANVQDVGPFVQCLMGACP